MVRELDHGLRVLGGLLEDFRPGVETMAGAGLYQWVFDADGHEIDDEDNPYWVNNYATAQVIRYLKGRVDELEKQLTKEETK